MWLSVRQGSVLREAYCQPPATDGKACEKKEATTCEKDAGTRSEN
jgi:hypothetical protein